MSLLVLDSKNLKFLNILLELAKNVGVKAELIETDQSIEEYEDNVFAEEIMKGAEGGFLSEQETIEFLNELRSDIEK